MAIVQDELSVKVEVLPNLEQCYHQTLVMDDDGIPMAKINIELSTSTPLSGIRVGLDVAEPLIVTNSSFIINSLSK